MLTQLVQIVEIGVRPSLTAQSRSMRISAKGDYAVRAMVELAAHPGELKKRDQIVEAQEIPVKFLENILAELKHGGLVQSQRGADGGYSLARPAEQITLADVLRVAEGPLASVRDVRPESLEFSGYSEPLPTVWVALRASMRVVLEAVTLADVVAGELPSEVTELASRPDSWISH